MRLLTDEELKRFKLEANRRANDLQQSTEGNFTQEDIERIYRDADDAMLVLQRNLTQMETLKAVGEFVEDWERLSNSDFDIKYGIHTYPSGFRMGNLVDTLKLHFEYGEMPEEGE